MKTSSKDIILEFIKSKGEVSKKEVIEKFIGNYSLATINYAIMELKYSGKIKTIKIGREIIIRG